MERISISNIDINELRTKHAEVTGNKPAQGKIARNKSHISDGVFNKKLLFKGENGRLFNEFRGNLLAEIVPLGQMEIFFAEKFIFSAWELRRLKVMEKNVVDATNLPTLTKKEEKMTFGLSSMMEDDLLAKKRIRNLKNLDLNDPKIALIQSRALTVEKTMYKALRKLQELQAARKSGVASNPQPDEDDD